ncbi:MAG: hypothetical protein K5777_05000 [Nitrosopumilus sp.]|nr:hypothetical protein [Nitrosopumilus sp.]
MINLLENQPTKQNVKLRQGILYLISTLAGWILTRVFDSLEPAIITSATNITHIQILMIIDFVFIGISIFGVFLILNGKRKWINLSFKSEDKKSNFKYDSKKLNNEVFKKLMRVICLESRLFFKNRFGFCIPVNPKMFEIPVDSAQIAWYIDLEKPEDFERDFKSIGEAIPTLKIGEKYLETNYVEIYKIWKNIKNDLEKINKDRDSFFAAVAKDVGKQFKKTLNYKSKFLLDPFGDEIVFFEENISFIIPLLFKTRLVNLSIEQIADKQYYVRYGDSYNIIGSNKEEKINLSGIKHIFDLILWNENFSEQYSDYRYQLIELNKRITIFCHKLEKEVVNDIENIV